ncbi:MAG: hypothetical protein ACSHX7_02635 [Luteolibacter sp.]
MHLGQSIWRDAENIEEISVEYWSLRKLAKELDTINKELDECQGYLTNAHEERAGLLSANADAFQDLLEERKMILAEMDEASKHRDGVISKAREIRRTYEGLKTKLEVLTKEGDHTDNELEKISSKMKSLKQTFSELKKERTEIGEKVEAGNTRIDAIEDKIESRKKDRRGKASEAFQDIGGANKRMSALGSEAGVLNTKMRSLYSEIGRYVSLQSHANPECERITKPFHGMVEVMHALRRSIQYNHRLSEE